MSEELSDKQTSLFLMDEQLGLRWEPWRESGGSLVVDSCPWCQVHTA